MRFAHLRMSEPRGRGCSSSVPSGAMTLTATATSPMLRGLARQTPGAELREGYLGDEDFDRWVVASDALVLPYRAGWSSNVMERGRSTTGP